MMKVPALLYARLFGLAFHLAHDVIIDNMIAASAVKTDAVKPPNLYFDMTGETFEFQTSAKTGDGIFRFRWTLSGGKKGPPEHIHEEEAETFAIVSGTLRIWLDGVPQDLGPGQSVVVKPGVRHKFFNPTKELVVVDVSLDGPKQEDALVPLAFHCNGRRKMKFGDFTTMIAHVGVVRASVPPNKVAVAFMNGLSRLFRFFGARPLPLRDAW